jgi:hypothetical protein
MTLPGVHLTLSGGGSSSSREEGAYIDHAIFNHTHYFLLLRRLQQWTAHHLTTTALAQRLLRVMGLQEDSWHTAQVLYERECARARRRRTHGTPRRSSMSYNFSQETHTLVAQGLMAHRARARSMRERHTQRQRETEREIKEEEDSWHA